MAEPRTIGSQFLEDDGASGEWKPGAERRVLKEINGHQYIVLEHAGENRGSWQFHSATPYTPPGGAPATSATFTVTDPATGAQTQVAMTKDQIEADTAALKYQAAKEALDSGLDPAKARLEFDAAVEALNQAAVKGVYLEDQIRSDLATEAQNRAIAASQETRATQREPLTQADIVAGITGKVASATGTQIDNLLKTLGGLGTYQAQRNAVAELYENGDIDESTMRGVMDRLRTSLTTGVSPEKRFEEEQATGRQVLTNQAALEREQLQEQGRQATARQTAQTTAATSIAGDEAARGRQLLSSAVTQQGNQAQAVNSFINNYQQAAQQGASLAPTQTGAGFLNGLSMVRDIFTSIKDLAQPAPQIGQAQGFLGNLLAGGPPAPAPAVAGPAAPVGTGVATAAAAGPQREIFDDPLVAAAAMGDDTPLPPEDVAQIMPLIETDPQRAANLSVAAWQRMVSGTNRRAEAT